MGAAPRCAGPLPPTAALRGAQAQPPEQGHLPEARRALQMGCRHLESTPLCCPGFTDGVADAELPGAQRGVSPPWGTGCIFLARSLHMDCETRTQPPQATAGQLLGREAAAIESLHGAERRAGVTVWAAEAPWKRAVLWSFAISPSREGVAAHGTVSRCLQ